MFSTEFRNSLQTLADTDWKNTIPEIAEKTNVAKLMPKGWAVSNKCRSRLTELAGVIHLKVLEHLNEPLDPKDLNNIKIILEKIEKRALAYGMTSLGSKIIIQSTRELLKVKENLK